MPDPHAPLPGARCDGFARVESVGPVGMIVLRADLAAAPVADVVSQVAQTGIPAPLEAVCNGATSCCWMAPDELLLILPLPDVGSALDRIGEALANVHHLAQDVSGARAVFRVSGPCARDVLTKLTPADVAPGAFPPGRFRRTRLAQVPAALWMRDDATIDVLCFRSVALYAFDLLCLAARRGGEVGLFPEPAVRAAVDQNTP